MPSRISSADKLFLRLAFLNQKSILIFLVIIVILITGFVFMLMPLYDKFVLLSIRYKQEDAKLRGIQEQSYLAGDVRAKLITDSQDIAIALEELTKKAQIFGFHFDTIRQGNPIDIGAGYKILPIAIQSTCSFQALANFMSSLDTLRKSVTVVNKLDVVKEKGNISTLKVSLELGTYISL